MRKKARAKEHNRAETIVSVPHDQLYGDPTRQNDPIFSKLFGSEVRAKSTSGFTRVSTDRISIGFFRLTSGASEQVIDPPNPLMPALISAIRGGSRPRVYLYWSPLSPHESKFVCPDDQVTLTAYRMLGIEKVPAHVLDIKADYLEESAITFRGLHATAFQGAMPHKPGRVAAMANAETGELSTDIGALIDECELHLKAIKAFHRDAGRRVHYHQSLYARVHRHRRCLESIARLSEAGNTDHAVALVRLLYEGFLGFYLDWLCPDYMGPRIQYFAEYSRLKRDPLTPLDRKAKLKPPKAIMGGLAHLLGSVEEKARLSPLGDQFHSAAYPPLSAMVHQDYGELDLEGDAFTEELGNASWQIEATQKWTNAITTEFLLRVAGEIGGVGPTRDASSGIT